MAASDSPDLRVDPEHQGRLCLPSPVPEVFRVAAPFPHIVLDGVLTGQALDELDAAFPEPGWSGWRQYRDSYQRQKMISSDLLAFPAVVRNIVVELSSPPFLRYLEALSGIPGLIPDPYLEGGGLHCSGPGGVLAPHTDFHVYERLGLYRRINVILYLNRDWDEPGGELELFADESAQVAQVSVRPTLGRIVIFRTDHGSVHGIRNCVPPNRWRRSIALYYYTAAEARKFSGDTNTYWRRHAVSSRIQQLRLLAYRLLLFLSKGFSHCAHRVNPHLGPNRGPK